MEDYLEPVVRKELENIILHVGTNDLNKNCLARSNSTGNYQLGNPDKSGLPSNKHYYIRNFTSNGQVKSTNQS